MKSKQLLTKAISKSTALLMIGATVIASGASMNVYAKDVTEPNNIKVITYKVDCNKPGNSNDINHKPNRPNLEDCISKPGTDNSKPELDNSRPEIDNSKPEIDNSKPELDNSKPEVDNSKPETDNSTPDTNVSTQAAFENRVLELVNIERQKEGLSPLQMDESVRSVARLKSEDMRINKYFDHTSPTYGSPFDMLQQFGISYRSAGENIAQGYSTPEAVVTGWMNSSGHRANILNSSFTHIGIGYDSNGHYWTQMFIGK